MSLIKTTSKFNKILMAVRTQQYLQSFIGEQIARKRFPNFHINKFIQMHSSSVQNKESQNQKSIMVSVSAQKPKQTTQQYLSGSKTVGHNYFYLSQATAQNPHIKEMIKQQQKQKQLISSQIHQDRPLINSRQQPSHYIQSSKPELLDINRTQQTREKHFLLKNTIQSTIQQLLKIYKSKSSPSNSEEQKRIRNQVFDRFAFIFTEMNEFKGQIEHSISYLNYGQNCQNTQIQTTPNKKTYQNIQSMPEIQQSLQESSMQEENEQKNQQGSFSPNFQGHASLEERFQSKLNENNMQAQP